MNMHTGQATLTAAKPALPHRHTTDREMIALVAYQHGLSVDDLTGRDLGPRVTSARHAAMHMLSECRREDGVRRWSNRVIGKLLGGRDPRTVGYGVEKHQARLDAAPHARRNP